jgi:hypothetical protein
MECLADFKVAETTNNLPNMATTSRLFIETLLERTHLLE